jgi:small-conductance mechanosensitive channel
LLRAVAALQPGIITTPPPVALLLGFGSIALNFELRAWTNRPEQWIEVRSELNVAVYAALQAAGIEIPCDRNNPPSA